MNRYLNGWKIRFIGSFIKEKKERLENGFAIPYSVSKVLGIVPQREKFKKRVASSDISKYKIIRKGDFAYDPMLLWDGSINRMNRDEIGAISPAYVTFQINSQLLDSDYFLYFLKEETTKNFYKSISKGTNVRRQKAEFRDFVTGEFLLPPIHEQKKIVEVLTTIDSILINSKLKLEKIKLLKISLREEFLTKGLVKEECKPSKLGNIPKSWEIKKLREIGSCIRGLTYSPNDISKKGLLVLRSSNIADGNIVFDDSVYVNKEVKSEFISSIGDILICVRNGSRRLLGKSAVITSNIPLATHGAFMTIFRTKQYEFVKYLIESNLFFKQVSRDIGATINSINNQNLLDYEFAFPSIEEQKEIVLILSSLDKRIMKEKEYLSKIENIKRSLVKDLLSGTKRFEN